MRAVPLPIGPRLEAFDRLLAKRWQLGHYYSTRRDALVMGLGLLGLRWVEVVRLRVDDFDFDARTLLVRTAKRGARRVVFAGDLVGGCECWLRSVGRPWWLSSHAKQLVFLSRNGKPLTHQHGHRLCRNWTRDHFGTPYSFHCLRHTAAVRVWQATRDVLAVQQQLGHRSLHHTQVYLASLLRLAEPVRVGLPGFVDAKSGGLRVFKEQG